MLPEFSSDGPALNSVVGTFEGTSFNNSVSAWIGTDRVHHLNVETSSDGLHFGHKLTLAETSPFRPDVTQLGEPAGGNITVAWTGSDANRSLNVLFDVYGSHPQKLTLRDDKSFSAPALLQQGATLFLAWTGTDAQHALNILPITIGTSGLVPGQKAILGFLSSAGPHLSLHAGNDVVLNWISRDLGLNVAASADGVNFPTASGIDEETSAFAPDTVFFTSEGGPGNWIGWTGRDASHHLNLQWSTSFLGFSDPDHTQTTLNELALGGPALAFNAGPQIAWTGGDAAHHLNIATFEVR